jgi:hypothetical protein
MAKTIAVLALCALCFGAAAAESKHPEVDAYLWSESLVDPGPNEPIDRLIIEIKGKRAKELFSAMPGSPWETPCGDTSKFAGDLECRAYSDGTYSCAVGIMLDTGKTTFGSTC